MAIRRPLKKGKKACTECRQQKAKCDVYLDLDQPCTRCRKVKATCVVSDPFKREHKRKRLSELERESDELRQKLRASHPADPHPSPIALLTAAAEMDVHSASGSDSISVPSQVPPDSYPPQLLAPAGLPHDTPEPGPVLEGCDPTKPRSLNGVEVSSEEIDDLFRLFFHQYAQFLPILDPTTRPNTYFAQSPFLFWSVIGVSCRAYPRNPTLLMALARSIIEMALLSAVSSSPPWHTIQALLLLLTWPFPKGDHPDVTFPLSGLLLHIAMQNGLHIPMSSHEFSRVKTPVPSEADLLRRSELWAHSLIVYQRVCVTKGQLPRVNQAQDPAQRHALFDKIASWMALKLRCQDLIARCSEAVMENGMRSMSLDQERSLDIILRTYEGQVDDLELRAVTDDERFHTFLCRMSIQSFHFYKIQTLVSSGCFPRVLVTACSLIDYIQSLKDRLSCLAMVPAQMSFGLLMASISLLRILKSSTLSQGLETGRARNCLFNAINLAKEMSVDPADVPAKTVTVLNAAWNSNRVFRKADGSEYTALRIRGRLVLSPILDTVWWWRDEFDPQSRSGRRVVEPADGTVYSRSRYLGTTDAGRVGASVDTSRDMTTGGATMNGGILGDAFRLDEQFLADFEWALGEDALFSLDPLPTNWSSTNNLL
ncbi:uncharacterized protein N7459_005525 [Penicillium hispanicum]|uniref:uncharacterized protein n=1 Tax=Penicillium hispanicum TaxID=1080232 RepID=UPI0025411D98|nr:uncharacterized protein N7459_005525 [Penicillium hispanicum]KAJ5579540.1 hypothetical protein N7459_005525 [Penicillium hispanicum]